MLTALADAMTKAGWSSADAQFDIAIARYLNNGGTIERAYERVRLAAEKSGQVGRADNGQMEIAGLSQLDGGHKDNADNGHLTVAPIQPLADGAGPKGDAPSHIPAAPPVREPTPTQNAAVAKARAAAALSVFDREYTRTNQKWGNVCYCDLEAMVADADIAAAVRHHLGQLPKGDRLKMLRELMTPREFTQLLNRVRRHAA